MKIVIVGQITPPSAAHSVATEVAGVNAPAIVALDDSGNPVKAWTAEYNDAEVTAWAAKTQDSLLPLSKVEIMRRITSAEWKALETSAHQDARYALAVFNAAPQVDRNDPLTVQLFGALEAIGILAAGRAAAILA